MNIDENIKEAAINCRAAWAECPDAKFAWTCHHGILWEPLTEPAESRIKYILEEKYESEIVTRLNNFRPVRVALPPEVEKAGMDYLKARADAGKAWLHYQKVWEDLKKASADYAAELTTLHNTDWPDNTWNGKSIFKWLQ